MFLFLFLFELEVVEEEKNSYYGPPLMISTESNELLGLSKGY